jgi:branched-chain amino acid aminotransferase
MRVWVNGVVLTEPDQPSVSATDHGFTVGDGVFESIKVINGEPFALTRHLTRLGQSARGLGLPALDNEVVRAAVHDVLAGQGFDRARLRITYTAGPAPMGSGRGNGPTTLVVSADALGTWDPIASIVIVPWPRNERSAVAGLKTTSYAENVIALDYAHERGAGEALFVNTLGNVCEGTGSNVFYVVDGQLRTPSLESGCLAGITRDLILQWCDGVEVDEPIDVLASADEVFLASTTRDVQPVGRVDDRDLVAPGPVTLAAMKTWVQREAEQVDP